MPSCNIIGCRIKRSGNHPKITLHQLPANKVKKKMWLETVGVGNLKMTTKTLRICSLHFEESCFNRTLNKVTLRDDALPSRALLPGNQSNMSGILIENDQNQTESISGCGALNGIEFVCVPAIQYQPEENSKRSGIDLGPTKSATLDLITSPSAELRLAASTSATPDLSVHTFKMIEKLKDRCQIQSKKIKRLNEKVRRQTKKIADLSNIIKDFRKRNLLNSKSQALHTKCAGPPETS